MNGESREAVARFGIVVAQKAILRAFNEPGVER
jgi:hypothetical protein